MSVLGVQFLQTSFFLGKYEKVLVRFFNGGEGGSGECGRQI